MRVFQDLHKCSLVSMQAGALLDVDVNMLTAFPTARGLARYLQQATGSRSNNDVTVGQVGPVPFQQGALPILACPPVCLLLS